MLHKLYIFEGFALVIGFAVWAHVVLALVVRAVLRSDDGVLAELFAFAPAGRQFSRKPFLMPVKLFFPWVPVLGLVGYPKSTRRLVWSARLAGTSLFVCFIGLIGYVAYMVYSGA